MRTKYIVEFYDENGELEKTHECKTYREMAQITDIEYHNIRTLHMIGNGTLTKKFMHPTLTKLQKKIKIIDI